ITRRHHRSPLFPYTTLFRSEFFPRGARFPAHDVPGLPDGLPLAEVRAFSLDDVGTSEIDDAFSLQRTGEKLRVGIHIAAPGLARSEEHTSELQSLTNLVCRL